MGGFSHDSHLGSGHRNRWYPQLMQGHREQGNRDLFSGGEQHVHLPLRRSGADRFRLGGELVCGVAHGRHHNHQIIAVFFAVGDAPGDGLQAFHAADGRAAELLHQQGHQRGPMNL